MRVCDKRVDKTHICILLLRFKHQASSYGEALLANGKPAEATQSYKKAVQVAEANEDPNPELFRTNLKAAEQKTIKRP